MYPIGFVSIAAYLEQNSIPVRIFNIANRMLNDSHFDVEKFLKKLNPLAFGIDLHWLPHAHGSLELAKIIKKFHPQTPVIFGGLSSSYYYKEILEQHPEVDFVVRGDSTEEPMLNLMQKLAKRETSFEEIPNLSWRGKAGEIHHNSLTFVPSSLDGVPLDYNYPVHSAIKQRKLWGLLPFKNWRNYPITAVFTCRGCTFNCVNCGGSRFAYKKICNRQAPAYRSPEVLVKDIKSVQRFIQGPVFVIGDIRQPGEDYAEEFLELLKKEKINSGIILELFAPAGREFFRKVSRAVPKFYIEMTPESHDEEVRYALKKMWKTRDVEETIESAFENGCLRFDLFFMIGLPKQDTKSVMDTVSYCRSLVRDLGKNKQDKQDKKFHPMISPLVPFIDPGSEVFEFPEKYGYHLFYRTLEEHRRALVSPSWKYMLSYETDWLSRDELVAVTYEAASGFNNLKRDYGLISPKEASEVEMRIRESLRLVENVDSLVKSGASFEEVTLDTKLREISLATICEKRELEWASPSLLRSFPRILWGLCRGLR
jgi:B12-binding domain/radical SAM domain protein